MHYSARLSSEIAHPISNLRRHVYKSLEYQLGTAPTGRLGLAISGGVDSMALASLCSSFTKQSKQYQAHSAFSGFIVDHGVRDGSRQEASEVAKELQHLGIESEILSLDWSPYGNPKCLTNFETIARRLRYQAIGKACFKQRITTVLVGHHADDLAETVLSRIVARYLGEGLQGVKPRTPIPECGGIYGVGASGIPRKITTSNDTTASRNRRVGMNPGAMAIESGGIYMGRPLLLFAKAQLIELCQQDGVRWFEDSTNADPTLTVRNAIRYLQQNDSLPAALQRQRLAETAGKLRRKHELYEQRAEEIYNSMPIQLDLKMSRATFSLPEDVDFSMTADGVPYHVKAVLTRRLLMLVSPLQAMSLQDLDPAIDVLFTEVPTQSTNIQVQGVIIRKNQVASERHDCFTVSQQRPRRSSLRACELSPLHISDRASQDDTHYWTDWLLWDNRYWIRVGCLPADSTKLEHLRFFVNFINPTTIHTLRSSIESSEPAVRVSLDAVLNLASDSRWSQPVLTMKIDDGKSSTVEVNQSEEAIALPALGWTKIASTVKRLNLVCQIRYRAIDFGAGKNHTLVEPEYRRKPDVSRARAVKLQAKRLAELDKAWSSG